MITLDYTDLDFDGDAAVLRAPAGDFHYELLFAYLVFRVGPADFSLTEEPAPLLDLSLVLKTILETIADGEEKKWESPISWNALTFARAGDEVAITSNYVEALATAPLAELQQAAAAFQARVMQDVLVRYPGLVDNPGAQKFIAAAGASG